MPTRQHPGFLLAAIELKPDLAEFVLSLSVLDLLSCGRLPVTIYIGIVRVVLLCRLEVSNIVL